MQSCFTSVRDLKSSKTGLVQDMVVQFHPIQQNVEFAYVCFGEKGCCSDTLERAGNSWASGPQLSPLGR